MKNSKILCMVLSSLFGLYGGFNSNINAHKIENSQNTKAGNSKTINLYNRIKELEKN